MSYPPSLKFPPDTHPHDRLCQPNYDSIELDFAKALDMPTWDLWMSGNILMRCHPDRSAVLLYRDALSHSIEQVRIRIYEDDSLKFTLAHPDEIPCYRPGILKPQDHPTWGRRRYKPLDILRWGHKQEDIRLHDFLLKRAELAHKRYSGSYRTEAIDALNMVLNEFYASHTSESFEPPKKDVVVAYLRNHYSKEQLSENMLKSIDSICRPESAKQGGQKGKAR